MGWNRLRCSRRSRRRKRRRVCGQGLRRTEPKAPLPCHPEQSAWPGLSESRLRHQARHGQPRGAAPTGSVRRGGRGGCGEGGRHAGRPYRFGPVGGWRSGDGHGAMNRAPTSADGDGTRQRDGSRPRVREGGLCAVVAASSLARPSLASPPSIARAHNEPPSDRLSELSLIRAVACEKFTMCTARHLAGGGRRGDLGRLCRPARAAHWKPAANRRCPPKPHPS